MSYEPEKFTRTYFYPGEYDVSLQYYANNYSAVPDATQKITVKIIGADILISRVGGEGGFFVELSNNTESPADLSGWILKSDAKSFVFPKNTLLGGKKKMTLSPRITAFEFSDKSSLRLLSAAGELVFDYVAFSKPVKKIAAPVKANPPKAAENIPQSFIPTQAVLAAAPILSEPAEKDGQFPYLPVSIFVIFLAAASGGLYFVRRMKTPHIPGDNFELLDE